MSPPGTPVDPFAVKRRARSLHLDIPANRRISVQPQLGQSREGLKNNPPLGIPAPVTSKHHPRPLVG
jgi:hypothetical protein